MLYILTKFIRIHDPRVQRGKRSKKKRIHERIVGRVIGGVEPCGLAARYRVFSRGDASERVHSHRYISSCLQHEQPIRSKVLNHPTGYGELYIGTDWFIEFSNVISFDWSVSKRVLTRVKYNEKSCVVCCNCYVSCHRLFFYRQKLHHEIIRKGD